MEPIAVAVFIAGLFLGTLVNIVIIRLPRERGLSGWPRCTRCGTLLEWVQVLPLIGWLAQRGRAGCCGRQLHWMFLLIEPLTALALLLLFQRHGANLSFLYLTFVVVVLIITGAIDWLHRWVYTAVILGSALLVLLASLVLPGQRFANHLLGALIAGGVFLIFFALAHLLFRSKATPFGMGDVYIAIFIGAVFGLTNMMPALFYGILLAGIFSAILLAVRWIGRAEVPQYISYGTFMCLGALGYLLIKSPL